MSSMLFAYGTLMPADHEAARREGWRPDAVRGRLFDLGPYPALVDLDDPGAGWVEGFVRPVDTSELETRLDPWEEVDRGVYRRAETTTRSFCRVWVYVYNQPLPPGARGPMDRWEGRSGRRISSDRNQPEETHDGEDFAPGCDARGVIRGDARKADSRIAERIAGR